MPLDSDNEGGHHSFDHEPTPDTSVTPDTEGGHLRCDPKPVPQQTQFKISKPQPPKGKTSKPVAIKKPQPVAIPTVCKAQEPTHAHEIPQAQEIQQAYEIPQADEIPQAKAVCLAKDFKFEDTDPSLSDRAAMLRDMQQSESTATTVAIPTESTSEVIPLIQAEEMAQIYGMQQGCAWLAKDYKKNNSEPSVLSRGAMLRNLMDSASESTDYDDTTVDGLESLSQDSRFCLQDAHVLRELETRSKTKFIVVQDPCNGTKQNVVQDPCNETKRNVVQDPVVQATPKAVFDPFCVTNRRPDPIRLRRPKRKLLGMQFKFPMFGMRCETL